METRTDLKPGDPEYQRLAREEIQHYSEIFLGEDAKPSAVETLFQPVPPSWIEMERRATAVIIAKTGFEVCGHVLNLLRASNGARMLSLGLRSWRVSNLVLLEPFATRTLPVSI